MVFVRHHSGRPNPAFEEEVSIILFFLIPQKYLLEYGTEKRVLTPSKPSYQTCTNTPQMLFFLVLYDRTI